MPARLSPAEIQDAQRKLADATPEEVLRWALSTFGDRVGLATSFGPEDQVLTHLLAGLAPAPVVFALDTGRLPAETYEVAAATEARFGLRIRYFYPDAAAAEAMVREKGINLFYESIENRKLCCNVRKVEPLRRALSGLDAWVTGLRRDQNVTRADVPVVEVDAANGGIAKINPLARWSEADVWRHLREHGVPYNALHARGYPSIGCAPCTRAVLPGEHARAGRWWWESAESRECGLHARPAHGRSPA